MSEKALEAQKLAEAGLTQLRQGNVDAALTQLEDALRLDPTNFSIQVAVANAVSEKGELERAMHLFTKAKRGDKFGILIDYNVACCLHKKGDLDEAARRFVAIAKRAEASLDGKGGAKPAKSTGASEELVASAYANAGLCLEARGRSKEALRLLERSLRRGSPSAYHYALVGVGAFKKGEPIEAVEGYFDSALAADSACFLAHLGMGVVEEAKGNPQGAIEWLEKAFDIQPEDIAPLFRIGQLKLQLENFQEAHAVFMKCLARQPASPTVLLHCGLALMGRGSAYHRDAADMFQKVLDLNPRNRCAQFQLIMVKKAMGEAKDLIAQLKRATMALSPESDAYVALGTAYLDLGKPRKAEQAFRAGLRVDGKDALAHAGLATALQRLSDLHGAISEYKAAMELGSSLYWVRYNLGALYERRGEHDEAVSYYEQATKDATLTAAAHAAIAGVLIKKGRFEEAQRRARQALYSDSNCTKALLCLGICSVRIGRRDEIRIGPLMEGLRLLEASSTSGSVGGDATASRSIERCLFHLTLGIAHHLQENMQGAIPAYEQAIAGATGLLEGRTSGGRFEEETKGSSDGAITMALEDQQSLRDCRICASMNLAAVLQSLGDESAALAQYRKTLQWDPTNKTAYALASALSSKQSTASTVTASYLKAVTLHENQRFEEAIKVYESVLQVDPKDHLSLCGIGLCRGAMKQYSEAVSSLKRCLAVKSDDERARTALVAMYSAAGNHAMALTEAEAAADLLPSSAEVQANYARVLMQEKKYQAACVQWRKALALNGKLPFARYAYGLSLCAAGEYQPAINEFKIALQQHPKHADAMLALAQAHQIIGEPEDAALHYSDILNVSDTAAVSAPSKLLQLDNDGDVPLLPKYPLKEVKYLACVGLAQMAHNGRELAAAKKYYKQALQFNANGTHALVGLAAIEEHEGNYKDAVELLHTAATVNPLDDEIPERLNRLVAFMREQKE